MMFTSDQHGRDMILFELAGAALAIAVISIWC
jgi:hypothetical protein